MGYLAWMIWFIATIVIFGVILGGTALMATGWHRSSEHRHLWSLRHH